MQTNAINNQSSSAPRLLVRILQNIPMRRDVECVAATGVAIGEGTTGVMPWHHLAGSYKGYMRRYRE